MFAHEKYSPEYILKIINSELLTPKELYLENTNYEMQTYHRNVLISFPYAALWEFMRYRKPITLSTGDFIL